MKKEIHSTKLEAVIDCLVRELDPERIFLFGSRARGSFRPGSDFDIAVKGGRSLDFRAKRKLKEKLELLLGLYSLDLIFWEEATPDFRCVIEQGVLLYEKD